MACGKPEKRLIFLAVGFGSIFVATVFVIVGLCTNYWMELRNRDLYDEDVIVHMGLHRVCWVSNDRCNNPGNDYDEQNTLPAVQGLVITGGFVCVVASLLSLANLLLDRLGRSKALLCAAAAVIACLAGLFEIIGVIIYAVKVDVHSEYLSIGSREYQGYSFGLTATAGGLMIIGAVLNGISGLSDAQPMFNY